MGTCAADAGAKSPGHKVREQLNAPAWAPEKVKSRAFCPLRAHDSCVSASRSRKDVGKIIKSEGRLLVNLVKKTSIGLDEVE